MARYRNGYGSDTQVEDIPMAERSHSCSSHTSNAQLVRGNMDNQNDGEIRRLGGVSISTPRPPYNPAYQDDSISYEKGQVVVDMTDIRLERRGSDGSSEYCPEGSQRRRWAATRGPRDTAELINALPSRQLEQIACDVAAKESLRRRKSSKRSFHGTLRAARGKGVDELALSFSRNQEYMDELDGEAQTAETLRHMALSIKDKKEIKKRASGSRRQLTEQREKEHWLVEKNQIQHGYKMTWMHFKQGLSEFAYSLELWRSHMKKIEGHFGTDVTSYFLFLKWLFLLNIPIFILTFGFVIIPQIIYRYKLKDPSGYDYPPNNVTSFTGEELLTGGNWFNETEMYYGFYTNETIAIGDSGGYDMKYAYLFTCGGYYILCLLTLAVSLSRSYKMNYIGRSSTHAFNNVSRVFCGWDYNLTNEAAVLLKHKSFYNEMKEYLSGTTKTLDEENRWKEKCTWFFIRLLTNLLVFGIIGGLGYLVISLPIESTGDVTILREMVPSLYLSAIILVFPPIFSAIARLERYEHPKQELYINMCRTMLLKGGILGILVYIWFTTSARKAETDKSVCWETDVGVQIYRLVLVDFFFILGSTFVLEFLRRIFGKYCCKMKDSCPDFDIGRNTLDLIYSQALCWLGTFYSPLLSFIMIVKLFIIFYVKMISVLQNCRPSLRPWRAAKTHTIFMGFLFFFFLLASVAVAIGIIIITPSQECGPFRGETKAYSVVTKLIESWKSELPTLHFIIDLISSEGCMASILVALCVGAYYMRIVMDGHKDMVTSLRQQLHMAGRDKTYLLKMLQDVNKKKKEKLTPSTVDRHLPSSSNATIKSGQVSTAGGRVFAMSGADSLVSNEQKETWTQQW